MNSIGELSRSSKILLCFTFLSHASSFAFPLLSTILITRTTLSSQATGWLMCVAFLLCAAIQPIVGSLLDRGRDRLVLGLAAAGMLLGISGIYVSDHSTAALVPALVIFVSSFSSVSTAASRILEGTVSDEARGKMALVLMGTVNFGFGVSSLLAFLFLKTHQSALLVLDAITTLLYIAALYFLRPEPRPSGTSSTQEASAPITRLDSRLPAIGGTFLLFISASASLSAIPLFYARQGDFGNQLSPIMFGFSNVVVAVAGIGFASRINEIPLSGQILSSTVLLSVGHMLVPWVDSQIKNVLVTLLWSAGEVFAYPITSRLIFASYPTGEAGRAAGIKASLMRLAMAATPAISAMTVSLSPWVFSGVLGAIPLLGGGLLHLASRTHSVERASSQPLLSLQAWIQAQFQRSILLFLSIALALIFVVNSLFILREKLGQLEDAGQAFISSQVPNLQIYDFTRMNSDLQIFARNKPVSAVRMLDSGGLAIGRWSTEPEAENETRAFEVRLAQTQGKSIIYRYDGGFGHLFLKLTGHDKSGGVVGSLEVRAPCFLLLKNMFLSAAALLLVMVLTYVFGLRLARLSAKTASGPLEALSGALQEAEQPDDLANLQIGTEIAEAEQLLQRFRQLGKRLQEEVRNRIEAQKREAIGEVAAQVAHDIRSPLAALDSVMTDLSGLPEDRRSLVRSAVGRIRDIANDLIERNRDVSTSSEPSISQIVSGRGRSPAVHLVSSHLDPLMSEKRLQFRTKMGVMIDSRLDASSYGLFALIEPGSFKRVLSNLINNSVEAVGSTGKVIVELSSERGQVILRVRDDGKGISPEVLSRLGRRGETHGKPEGLGLGLYHARMSIESWGGTLDIESAPGNGAIVTIRLPQAAPPSWFVSELRLPAGLTIAVLDDDTSIHHVWRERFNSLRISESGIRAVHFSDDDQFRGWVTENQAIADLALYLVDYELLGSPETGLQLVASLGIAQRSILVTSRSEERAILEDCVRLGARVLPKSLAGLVPISVSAEPRPRALQDARPAKLAVLVDDDPLVHLTWKMAARANGVELLAFRGAQELLAGLDRVPKDTPVYLDSELGEGNRGEQLARDLHALGYSDLYLSTGHPPESFSTTPMVKRIVGKEPPWQA